MNNDEILADLRNAIVLTSTACALFERGFANHAEPYVEAAGIKLESARAELAASGPADKMSTTDGLGA